MSDNEIYPASRIKRKRRTKAEMEQFYCDLMAIAGEIQPATVRQVFYAATVRHLVEKTENGYDSVGAAILHLRRAGRMPYRWIADNTRWMRKPRTYDNWQDALELTAETYRRSLWSDLDCHVEVWLEKDALAGVLYPETHQWDVPLMVCRGFSSESFLFDAAETIKHHGGPAYLYYFGDHDPSGLAIDNQITRRLHEFAPEVEINFRRVAVLPHQISGWDLPSRPVKRTDSRARNWTGECVELDAIDPRQLRQLVRGCIEQHIDRHTLIAHKAIEEAERLTLQSLLSNWRSREETP